jgi:hypothetical protein
MKHKTPKCDNPKAKRVELERSWAAMLAKHAKPLERGACAFGIKVKAQAPKPVEVPPRIRSNPNCMMGPATKAPPKIYTGNKIIGIATMHKSNMVPIFNEEAAIEVAQMRRN